MARSTEIRTDDGRRIRDLSTAELQAWADEAGCAGDTEARSKILKAIARRPAWHDPRVWTPGR